MSEAGFSNKDLVLNLVNVLAPPPKPQQKWKWVRIFFISMQCPTRVEWRPPGGLAPLVYLRTGLKIKL